MNNIKTVLTFILSLAACTGFGQFKQVDVGMIHGGQPISGYQLTTANPISFYDFDKTRKEMVIVSTPPRARDKEEITFIDLKSQKLVWSVKPDTRTDDIKMAPGGIFRYDGRKSFYLSKTNGIETWSKKGSVEGIDPRFNTVIDQSGNILNHQEGKKLATAKTEHHYGINEAQHVNDHTLVVAADGLFGIDTKNGNSWGYSSKTGWDYHGGKNSAANTGIVVASAVAFGLVGGLAAAAATGQLGGGNSAIVNKGNSNILIEHNTAYFASLENLIAVDVSTGLKKFEVPIPGSKTSTSRLYADGDNILLANLGYVLTDQDAVILTGHPFFAAYNKHTGKQLYMDSIGTTGGLAAAGLAGETFFANYNDNYVVAINTKTGQRIFTRSLKDLGLQSATTHIDPQQAYVEQKGGEFRPLSELHPGLFFIKDKGKFIYSYNPATKKTERFLTPVWEALRTNGKTIMRSDKAITLLKDGKNYAVLNLENAVVIDNIAVGINQNSVTIVDLKDINK